jgi:hypothetical protein
MKLLRWLAAAVVWILAGVVGLLGAVLSVTILLLPLGLPLLWLARRLYGLAGSLVLPRAARHPVSTTQDKAEAVGRKARKKMQKTVGDVADATPVPRRKRGLRRLLPT